MGIRFLLGRAGTGKSERILSDIRKKLAENPQGSPIFYIVPEQMTFQQEYALFQNETIKGSIRAQVVSFSRLAWRVLQETGGGTRQFISSVGTQMMLRKIIAEKESEWQVFQKALEKQGFLEQLENMITEFKRYRITPEMLYMQMQQMQQFVHKEPGEAALTGKLNDLVYIYENLIHALQGKYIDSEDQLQMLADKIKDAPLLENADIYLDGFHRFSPKELLVVEALMKKCHSVTVALTTDIPEKDTLSELDLFYQTKETYDALQTIAKENRIPINGPILLDPKDGRLRDRPYFAHLEQHFDVRPAPVYDGEVPIQIAEAVHPRAEVEGVAQEILRLVREEHYRFQDIAVFIRQTDVYHDLIDTIFADHDIPVFIDEKRSMLNHSLIELIRSVMDIVEGNWRYDAVFRVLKTGFIPSTEAKYPLDDDAIDELENYVLEYGIRSRAQWLGDDEWVFQRFRGFDQSAQTDAEKETQQRINAYRKQVARALQAFDENIRQAETVRERCEIIYILLEKLDVPARLEIMRETYDAEGQLEKAREQEQVWNAVIQLLDEMVEMAGDETMTMETFRAAIEAGFESLTFAHVPPSIDHVIVGTIDRSRISGMKCSFLLGVNDGTWPIKPSEDGMINEQERDILAEHGLQLSESSKRQLLDDWFYMYLAFTSANDYLWISYPLSDEEGKAKMPSQLIKRVEDLFPECCDHLLLQDPDELVDAERFITTPIKTRAALTAQLARSRKGYPIKTVWWHVLNWYIRNHPKYHTTYIILQSLYYQNRPVNLTKQTIEQLYPKQVKASVSRLESYYRCSYQHFAQYSLRLQERKTYKLDAPDIGQLFHEALKKITEWIQAEGKDFSQLTEHESAGYAKQAVENLAPVLQHQILHSSNRYKYIQQKLQDVITRATYILSEQARKSEFSPVGLELGFGDKQTLHPVTLQLPNGFELMLRGRIDRVDKAEGANGLFLRIIDYKSSEKGLDLLEVYYGLALQMLTYLDVVLSQSEQWLGVKAEPAGVLYFHVHNPMISGKMKMSDAEIEKELFKKYKMQGLLLSDEEIVKLMDTSLESGRSQIIPAGVKKNGGFYSGSRIADNETFGSLQQHIHHLMMQAGIDMTSGGVHLNPYQHKQQTACTYCPFRSVCQFDPILEENNYRKLTDMKDEEILEKLRYPALTGSKIPTSRFQRNQGS
ncbi:DNA helicase/exodeoxyribonuclease V, subunit B [Lentibacillus halodurans]|uniref:ATP-dependent helicase/deoxyribonuclease subunit B n=1 Tax=Lentibacillus halodurans TaxID=237679 RepID=A0A1I0VZR6_9BACI|nr:helicase-exonuclease AddAB subunit AddB [Lentibacillus halodurans]SFA81919.1 DNA helicase/exodeoxyribonuclease V, subunit B [Lentibacillus halodurans]